MMKKPKLSLMIVEDDDIDYLAIDRALKKTDIDAHMYRAKNGGEALQLLEDEIVTKPVIFLVDLQMPRLNGIEFLHHVRKSAKYHDSVVCVLSTSNDPGDIFDCYRYQIAAYFEKSRLNGDYKPLIDLLHLYDTHVSLPADYL